MGKHERDWVDIAEESVSAAINGKSTNGYINEIALSNIKHIEKKFNTTVISSKWTGSNNYACPGDVEVFTTEHPTIPVELKFSKENGSGTKANPSTNIVKKYLSPSVMSYPEFDAELGLKDERYGLVERYINRDLVNQSDYERTLREIRQDDKDFLDDIAEITKPGQVKYASYIAEKLNDQLDAAQNLTDSILGGNNTTVDSDFDGEVVYCVIKKFETEKQFVQYYDFEEMNSMITKVISSGRSVKFQNTSGKVVLILSVTWKNICQGGATPCFNVFMGNALKN